MSGVYLGLTITVPPSAPSILMLGVGPTWCDINTMPWNFRGGPLLSVEPGTKCPAASGTTESIWH